MQAFFLWSSEAVKSEAIDKEVKDKFFSKNLQEGKMKLDNLPLSGYEFLRDMFIDQNRVKGFIKDPLRLSKKKLAKLERVRPS